MYLRIYMEIENGGFNYIDWKEDLRVVDVLDASYFYVGIQKQIQDIRENIQQNCIW